MCRRPLLSSALRPARGGIGQILITVRLPGTAPPHLVPSNTPPPSPHYQPDASPVHRHLIISATGLSLVPGLGCGAFSCATTTSSRPSSPFISSTAAAANEPATARASGCHSQSFATIASTATNSTENAASTSGFTRVSSAASAAAAPGPSVGSSTPDGNFTPVTAETGASAGARANDDNSWGPLGEPKPDLVEKFLSLDVCSSGEQRRAERQKVLRDFQRHPADTGSPPVMVALWTHRVRSLVRVFDSGRKQLPSIRQLEMLANKRRRMLTWLRRTDFKSYSYTITKLGLRDIYVPAGGANRYREGTRSCDPVDDQINRLRFNFHTKYRQ
ncbi:hypothetical protein Vretifemale_446, partial [Volvox reticuliferus]